MDDLALSGAELASIQVPVLMVHGRDDRVVPWRPSSGQLIDLRPDSRLHLMANCGHWTMIGKTAEFLAVVQPFLGPNRPPPARAGRVPAAGAENAVNDLPKLAISGHGGEQRYAQLSQFRGRR